MWYTVLGRAWLKPQPAGVQVELRGVEHENLALHTPAGRVGDVGGDLKINRQATPDREEGIPFEEARPSAARHSMRVERLRRIN